MFFYRNSLAFIIMTYVELNHTFTLVSRNFHVYVKKIALYAGVINIHFSDYTLYRGNRIGMLSVEFMQAIDIIK